MLSHINYYSQWTMSTWFTSLQRTMTSGSGTTPGSPRTTRLLCLRWKPVTMQASHWLPSHLSQQVKHTRYTCGYYYFKEMRTLKFEENKIVIALWHVIYVVSVNENLYYVNIYIKTKSCLTKLLSEIIVNHFSNNKLQK